MYSVNNNKKRAGVAVLLDKIDFKTKVLLAIKKIFYNDKRSLHWKYIITIINICKPKNRTPKYKA